MPPTTARLTPAALIALSLLACPGPEIARRSSAPELKPAAPIGRLDARNPALALVDAAEAPTPHAPLLIERAGPWPEAAQGRLDAPILAAAEADGAGALWLIGARPGARLDGGRVFDTPPPHSPYPRPVAAAGRIKGGALTLSGDLGAMEGDRVALIGHGDGPPSQRVVGHARRRADKWVAQAAQDGPVTAARVSSLSAEQDRQELRVIVSVGQCHEDLPERWSLLIGRALEAHGVEGVVVTADAGRLGDAWLSVSPRGCQSGEPRLVVKAPKGLRLVRTPFWSPDEVSVEPGDFDMAAALIAGFRGDLGAALALASGRREGANRTAPLIRAALAIEAGWLADPPAVLGDTGLRSVEGRLLLAGAAHLLGALDVAEAHTAWAYNPRSMALPLDGEPEPLWMRSDLARAAALVALGRADEARLHLEAAIQRAGTPEIKIALSLGLVEVHLARGDMKGIEDTFKAIEADKPALPSHLATLRRTQAMIARIKGDGARSEALYGESARLFEESRMWRQGAAMHRYIVEIKRDSDPAGEGAALELAKRDALRSFDAGALSEVELARALAFATRSATSEAPLEGGQGVIEAAVSAAERVERYDQVAEARRYGLLLLPATADIGVKAEAMREALEAALASGALEEIAMLLSLKGRLEAARFNFEEAEVDLKVALSFARAAGDAELAQLIEAELAEIAR